MLASLASYIFFFSDIPLKHCIDRRIFDDEYTNSSKITRQKVSSPLICFYGFIVLAA